MLPNYGLFYDYSIPDSGCARFGSIRAVTEAKSAQALSVSVTAPTGSKG